MQLLLFQFHALDVHLQQLKPLLIEPFDANETLELFMPATLLAFDVDYPPLVHQYALVSKFPWQSNSILLVMMGTTLAFKAHLPVIVEFELSVVYLEVMNKQIKAGE